MRAPVYSELKSEQGTYVLWLYLPAAQKIQIGHFKNIFFDEGYYAYVGSAFGSGGVRARLGRHFKENKNKHWHIDYLREYCMPVGAWMTYSVVKYEHQFATILSNIKSPKVAIRGFGSTDCNCETHLFRFSRQPVLSTFRKYACSANVQVKQVKTAGVLIT